MAGEDNTFNEDVLRERVLAVAISEYKRKEELVGQETMRNFEKGVMLQLLMNYGKSIYQLWIIYVRYSFTWLCTKRSETRVQRIFPNVY